MILQRGRQGGFFFLRSLRRGLVVKFVSVFAFLRQTHVCPASNRITY
jgi:hypothetical protein